MINPSEKLSFDNIDAYLLTSDTARTYASGFKSSAGYVIITKDNTFLAVDFRYYEMAQKHCSLNGDVTLLPLEKSIDDNIKKFVGQYNIKSIGFEEDTLSVKQYEKIKTYLEPLEAKLFAASDDIWKSRSLKTPAEIEKISQAQRLTEEAFEYFLSIVRPGVSERFVSFEVEKFIRTNGGQLAFETIGISGPNTSLPHGVPSDRIIEKNDVFLLDFGAKVNNYCSDMTRTVCIGQPSDEFKKVYNIVLEANLAAIDAVKAGMTCKELDAVARNIIDKNGYGEYFAHSLGHGIGVECHEAPYASQISADIVTENHIFTIEPGIYLAGKFGVRIEDMVCVKDGKAQVITKTPKDLLII